MSTISAGTGLISGLPIQDLVDSLIAIQQRPITILQNRSAGLTQRRTALLGLSAQLLALKNAAARFSTADSFRRSSVASSNESVLAATAVSAATPGQYAFTVLGLASAHQVVSGGFATRDATPVGAGTLTFETSAALLNRSAKLSSLNAGAGVRAGKIRITDRAGGIATVDLASAVNIGDVVRAINNQTTAAVRARVQGDRLILEDQTGQTTGTLTVAEVGAGHTAADLGILATSASGVITGSDLVGIANGTQLTQLNDGNGVRRVAGLPDFAITLADGAVFNVKLSEELSGTTSLSILNRGGGIPPGSIKITNRAGESTTVDLSAAQTIADVKSTIESAATGITVTFVGGKLLLTDASTGTGSLKVEEVGSGTTAAALGLVGNSATNSLSGKKIYFIESVGDVVRLINSQVDTTGGANGGRLVASISTDGKGLTLTDTTDGGANALAVSVLNISKAADDLGLLGRPTVGGAIAGRRLLAGLESTLLRSLNGGSGIAAGIIEVTDRAGVTAQIDLSGAATLEDVIAAINAAAPQVTASITDSGLGIRITDDSGGTGNLHIADLSGTAAADLGIAVDAAVSTVANANLQRQYLSEATRLASLRNGLGIPLGSFRITNSEGVSAVVDLSQGDEVTLQDVIAEINSRGIDVSARINDTGDGLILEDSAGGAGQLRVTEEGGTTAAALGILGQAATGEAFLNGSFERRVTVGPLDTLNDVLARIQSSGAAVSAAIINDGSAGAPHRLSLTSTTTGADARIVFDGGATTLNFDTLVEAQDATLLFGPPGAGNPLVLHGTTNTFNDAIAGVRLELVSTSDTPVNVTVSNNVSGIVEDISSFVAAFNSLISKIKDLTSFNAETTQRGILQGDATARRIRDRMTDLLSRAFGDGTAGLTRLNQVGLTFGPGATLQFNETKFREAYEANPAAVEALFTQDDVGFTEVLSTELERLTEGDDGVIPLAEAAINSSQSSLQDRITQMSALLNRRRQRLLAQFTAAESALAELQRQQAALGALSGATTTGGLI